jgi:peptidyl-tRNA hydrolase, PTH1 family
VKKKLLQRLLLKLKLKRSKQSRPATEFQLEPQQPEQPEPDSTFESEPASAPSGPRLIVGLGNPGGKYVATRHNVGFDAIDLFASRLNREPEPLKVGGQRVADWVVDEEHGFALLWPLTFMNRSGGPVAAALRELQSDVAQMLVLTDDFHLDLGALRARGAGSAGGHNGLRSIEDCLQTQEYARLRIGVGNPRSSTVDFVLDTFRADEQEVIEETLLTASSAAEDWAKGLFIEDIQARYNRRKPQA